MSLLAISASTLAQTTVRWSQLEVDQSLLTQRQSSLISLQGNIYTTEANRAVVHRFEQDENAQWQSNEYQINSLNGIQASLVYNQKIIALESYARQHTTTRLSLITFEDSDVLETVLAPLPIAAKTATLSLIGDTLYALAQGGNNQFHFYSLDLSSNKGSSQQWQSLSTPRAEITSFYTAVQNDGFGPKIYALSKNFSLWQYTPGQRSWQQFESLAPAYSNTTVRGFKKVGQSHILAITNDASGATLNTITKQWTQYESHQNTQSASLAATNITAHNDGFVALLGNSDQQQLWSVSLVGESKNFGWVNMTVLIVYLLLVVLVGVYFMFKNRNTNDYFRGGQSIPWWAAACSIYATMLSSLTYVALPAIVYQTNWLLLLGTWMIILVAPIAIYVAMPFFRQIDATSAYEYLSKRFNMSVRLFASGLFTLFHIGRMGIVMALTALALAAVTPLTAGESVLLMGVLCLIYCTLGGIEAVIWTDTLQTVVLLIGAVLCFITIINGIDGGFSTYIDVASSNNKMTIINADFSSDSMLTLSLWVIVIGGIGQNLSSYTADQAVVQRYMVTSDVDAAKKSIWANALIAGPSALLFFAIGTGLYVFYTGQPEKLDPNMRIDQIFPAFIASELPVGIAGLIVAGIFAAAQSTVSTSMNSIATTLVTDFVRPFNLVKTEAGYMSAARWLTFLMGALGTLAGLIFIDPEIRSLMNAYFKVIGMFMGALGGLFVLGVLSKRANATGAMIGILSGVGMMFWAWQAGWANGYLYATIGIFSCLVIGFIASLFNPNDKDIAGLTLSTMKNNKPILN